MRKRLLGAMLAASVVTVATGCGAGGNAPASQAASPTATETPKPQTPVTLKLFPNQPVTDDDFKKLIADPVKKKYPYITVEMIKKDAAKTLTDYVAIGEEMDLITNWNGAMPSFKELGLYEDITPLAKSAKLDLTRFDQGALDTIKVISDKGELYGLPYGVQWNALYYNKDVFDKFGVSYPKDGMTWDDAIELAKKLTKNEGGVQYRGLDPDSVTRMLFPMSLNVVNAKANKSEVLASEAYKRVFEVTAKIYSIPGNKPEKLNQNATDVFMKEKNVAMLGSVNQIDRLKADPALNWDVAQYPSYPERPNIYGMFDMHVIMIPKTSKHKDEAIKVLDTLFSDDVQMISTRETGRVSPLKDPKFAQAFGADIPILKGKHLESIYKSKPAASPEFSIHYAKAIGLLTNNFYDYVNGVKDVNSALRTAEDQINQYIDSQKK